MNYYQYHYKYVLFVLGSKMLLYYDLISRLHTWLSCTACILASRGVFLFSVTYTY